MTPTVPGPVDRHARRADDQQMALHLGKHLMSLNDRLRIEPVDKKLRATRHGVPVLDSTDAMLVWEPRRVVPMYAVPPGDLHAGLLPRDRAPLPDDLAPVLGPDNFAWHLEDGQSYDVEVDGNVLESAAFRPDDPDLEGRVILDWAPFEWTEEAEPVTGHPHDAFKRIDALASDRHVTVSANGQVLADSRRAVALYETYLPVRWYFPPADVAMDRLQPSSTTTVCAYKGVAAYFSLTGGGPEGQDVAWTYPQPLLDAAPVKDYLCFFSERTDLTVDGVDVPRPRTLWSPPDS
jgi:uncharacterized protein (DUF427 family)